MTSRTKETFLLHIIWDVKNRFKLKISCELFYLLPMQFLAMIWPQETKACLMTATSLGEAPLNLFKLFISEHSDVTIPHSLQSHGP